MASEVISIVDPDNGGGTDYTSLTAWESGEEGDLTGIRDEISIARCRNSSGSADTPAPVISGWTTSATQYIQIEAMSGYENTGSWDTSNYYIHNNDVGFGVRIQADYVRIENIQVQATATSTNNRYAVDVRNQGVANDVRLDGLIVKFVSSASGNERGIFVNHVNSKVLIQNCLIYDVINNPEGDHYGIWALAASSVDVYNVTVHNCNYGIRLKNSGDNAKNCIVFDCGDDFFGTIGTVDYCASDDGDGTNAISPSGADWANEFTDYANDDFSIKNTGNVYLGSEITQADDSNVPSDDIIGTARNTGAGEQTSVGAFEFVAAGSSGDGAITPAGVLALQLMAYRLPAGQVSPVGDLLRYASVHRPTAGEITPTGDPGPKFSFRRAIDGVSSFVGSIARDASFRKAIDGVLSYLGDILKQKSAFRAVDGTITPSGALTKLRGITGRIQDGIISFAGALSYTSKGIYQKAVSGVLALAGEVARAGTIHRTIDGELDQTGDTSWLASFRREITGVLGMDGALGRVVGFLKAIVGVLSFSGETTEDYTQALSNSITSELSFAGPLASKAVFYRQVEGTISQAGDTERTDGWFARSNTGVLSFRASVPSPGGGAKARGLNKLGGMINLR